MSWSKVLRNLSASAPVLEALRRVMTGDEVSILIGSADESTPLRGIERYLFLILGPLLCLATLLWPAPAELAGVAWRLVGLILWMVVWWLSEAVPIPATALLPVVMMPLLGIAPQGEVTAAYGHPLIFLFLGGFLIAGALSRWGLHRRIALSIVRLVGTHPARLVGGVMLATAFLSMWISNTATAVMMYAVGVSLAEAIKPCLPNPKTRRRFGVALMLGIAYSASIGGLATLIGTPPNVLMAGFLEQTYGITVDFSRWLLIGLPFAVVLLPLTWVWLTRIAFPLGDAKLTGVDTLLRDELVALGPMRAPERAVLVVFALTALGWIFRPQLVALTGLEISDTSVAIGAALLLFALPVSLEQGTFVLDWRAAKNVAWDVLILFGGGLALASAFETTGLAETIGEGVASFGGLNLWVLTLLLATLVMFLGELTSNTASAATFLPIGGAVAVGLGVDPLFVAVPIALAASANFMLPVATPPNAVVFGYEDVRVQDMVRAGLVIDLAALGVIMLLLATVIRLVF